MSSGSSRSGSSRSGHNRSGGDRISRSGEKTTSGGELRRTAKEEQEDLEEEFTSKAPPTIFEATLSHIIPDPDVPSPPVPRSPHFVEKTLSFANALKKPSDASVPPSVRVNKSGGSVSQKKPAARATPTQAKSQPSDQSGSQGSSGQRPQADPLQSLKDDFRHLLTTKGKVGEGRSEYERKASIMAHLTKIGEKCFELRVDFRDLLADDRYIPLAVQCMKDRVKGDKYHGWLQPVMSDFLNTEFKLEDHEKPNLTFQFVHEAKSVKPLGDYPRSKLVKKTTLFRGEFKLPQTSFIGRQVYLAVVNHALGVHDEGRSWDGNFEAADIFIIEFEDGSYGCRIIGGRNSTELLERVSDWQQINTLVTPKYKLDGDYPAYFEKLSNDFEKLTWQVLRDTGFLTILPYHFAFMTPKARRYLLQEFYTFIENHGLQSEISLQEFKDVFGKAFSGDWRLAYKNLKEEDSILKGVYNHENRGGTEKRKEGQKEQGAGGSPTVKKDKFDRSAGSCLSYKRHVVQHASKHLCPFSEADDSELYAAWKIPHILPHIVGILFSGKKMKLQKELGPIWEHYCLMRDARDGN